MSSPISPTAGGFTPTGTISTAADRRRVVFATVVGTTVEWYDFFIYAQAAGLVFAAVFFEPAGPGIALILSFLTVGLSFLFRPLGAFLAGHFGDKYGRRVVLMVTLILMGVSTTLVGLLPTYAAIGIAAPILLIFLRILQGISAGGEWGGAVLMAVEHAPKNRRGLFGASPQLGARLHAGLAAVDELLRAVVDHEDPFIAAASAHLVEAGGKRFRPMLTLLAAELGNGINGDVVAAAAGVAHQLKGTSSTLGVLEMHRVCIQLDQLAAAGRLDGAGALIDQCEREFRCGLAALEEFLARHRARHMAGAPRPEDGSRGAALPSPRGDACCRP